MMSYVRGVSVVYSCVLKKCKCNAKDVTLHDSIVYWIARNKQDDSAILSWYCHLFAPRVAREQSILRIWAQTQGLQSSKLAPAANNWYMTSCCQVLYQKRYLRSLVSMVQSSWQEWLCLLLLHEILASKADRSKWINELHACCVYLNSVMKHNQNDGDCQGCGENPPH